MKIAMVTGATGFVGRNALAPLLARGFQVHAVARHEPSVELAKLRGVVWHRADLLRKDERSRLVESVRPDHLLHLAWVAEHGRFWEAAENVDWLDASVDLVARSAASGMTRMVAAGTCAEYDWSDPTLTCGACVENKTPCYPRTLYGRSKLQFGQYLKDLPGVAHAWGRLFFLYGPCEDTRRLVPSVIRSILAGAPAHVGPGTEVRDFLDARDAAEGLVALLDSDVRGPVNVASGRGISIAEIARTIGELMGHPERIALGALPAREGEPSRLVADVSRLRDEVGFRPERGLAVSLGDAIAWWGRAPRDALGELDGERR